MGGVDDTPLSHLRLFARSARHPPGTRSQVRVPGRGASLLCDGCVGSFQESPDAYLDEIKDWIVCPTCLAEKPRAMAVSITHDGAEVHFCRCPYCVEEFRKRPQELLARLARGAV